MHTPKISIIVATFNRWDLLQRWIESIHNQSYTNVELVVIENGSDAETAEGMKRYERASSTSEESQAPPSRRSRRDPDSSNWLGNKIHYLKPGRNTGFAGGNNLGAKEASGEYLFLLNNDAFLGKNTLRDLVAYATEHPKVAVLQPTILIGDGVEIRDTRYEIRELSNGTGSFLTKWGFLWHRGLREPLEKLPKQPDNIFTALGAGMLIKREVVSKHGLFDESFFAYFEETDFCWRLWTRGEQVAYVPTDPIWHMGGETSKVFSEKMVIFSAYRNRLIAFWRHLELGHLIQVLLLHHLAILGIMIMLLPKRPMASWWILVLFGWELINLPMLLMTRSKHLKKRSISDATLWPTIYRERSLTQMMQYLKG